MRELTEALNSDYVKTKIKELADVIHSNSGLDTVGENRRYDEYVFDQIHEQLTTAVRASMDYLSFMDEHEFMDDLKTSAAAERDEGER